MKDLPPSPSEHKEQLDWTAIKRSRGCDLQKTNKQTNKKTTIRQGEVVVFESSVWGCCPMTPQSHLVHLRHSVAQTGGRNNCCRTNSATVD